MGMVYFIQPLGGGLIKIGHAGRPTRRMKEMQTGCPLILRLLLQIPGCKHREKKIHRRFAAHRVHGEWFTPAPEILEFIDREREKKKCRGITCRRWGDEIRARLHKNGQLLS